MTENQSRKRNPGEYLEWKSLRHVLLFTAPALVGVAWLLPILIMWLIDTLSPLASNWMLGLVTLPGWVGLIGGGVLFLRMERGEWRIDNMLKGARSEAHVGQAIERAISSSDCAVAHNVENLRDAGEIDHLVATPSGLWVIETKAGFVARSRFREELSKIATNVNEVREWKPNVNVTGCIVFDDDPDAELNDYSSQGERIRSFKNPDALASVLLREAQAGGGSQELAESVWELGVDYEEDDRSLASR